MKSVLISVQPYWVFLIIARTMGWNVEREKTVEVRKNFPKGSDWNKTTRIYCSKDKKSFSKIPKEYQSFMERFLGKVIGEFICDEVYFRNCDLHDYDTITLEELSELSCVSEDDLLKYADKGNLYGWSIANLVIYDKPKDLSEFQTECKGGCDFPYVYEPPCKNCGKDKLKRPPQSWLYIKE